MIEKQKLSVLWASVTEVLERLQQMKALRERQLALLGSVDGRVQAKRAELENSLGDLTSAERLSVANRVVGSFRRGLIDETDATRVEMVRTAVRQNDEIDAISVHYQSAMQMLMRENLGSQRRGNICTQIETSGAVELASLASFAVATRDMELGAALCARNSGIKTAQRSFSSSELAEGLVGPDFDRAVAAIAEIRLLAREVINADRMFLTRRSNPAVKMGIAMSRAAIPTVADHSSEADYSPAAE